MKNKAATYIFLAGLAASLFDYPAEANPLKGSRKSLLEQNKMADKDDLSRIKDDRQLKEFIKNGYLVRVPEKTGTYYLGRFPREYAYTRPWTKTFIERLSSQYNRKFGKRLKINSLVRPIKYQNKLRERNANATKAAGPTASSHTTGATVDISKVGMSRREIYWMRGVLSSLDRKNIIEATEEHMQYTFHVMVYRDEYKGYVKGKR